jgi:hypothetical protein
MFDNKIAYRDKIIRQYLKKRDWDDDLLLGQNAEFLLMRKIIEFQFNTEYYDGILGQYPYIYNYEYEIITEAGIGKGDFIFTDMKGNYLIVECKSVSQKSTSSKRTAKRKKLREQVPRYVKHLKFKLPNSKSIIGLGITDMKEPFKLFCMAYFNDSPFKPIFNVNYIEEIDSKEIEEVRKLWESLL